MQGIEIQTCYAYMQYILHSKYFIVTLQQFSIFCIYLQTGDKMAYT